MLPLAGACEEWGAVRAGEQGSGEAGERGSGGAPGEWCMLAMADQGGVDGGPGKAKKPRKRYDILKTASCTVCGEWVGLVWLPPPVADPCQSEYRVKWSGGVQAVHQAQPVSPHLKKLGQDRGHLTNFYSCQTSRQKNLCAS